MKEALLERELQGLSRGVYSEEQEGEEEEEEEREKEEEPDWAS